jgi:hypothetical protein
MQTVAEETRSSTGTLTELYLGVLWLVISAWTAHATLTGGGDDLSGALGAAVSALPGIVATTLLTGASIGGAAGSRFRGPGGRLFAGLGLGILFGLAAAAGIRFGYGDQPSITAFAVVVGLAAALGGAAALLPEAVLGAALWATSWVFFAGVIFGVWQPNVVKLLGGGPDAAPGAQTAADIRFTFAQSILTGLFAGLMAYRSLRSEVRARAWYLVAGAFPGVLLLAAEGLMRLGGSSLVGLVTGFGAEKPALVELTDWTRVRHALIVLAVGGLLSLIRGPEREDDSDSSSDDDDQADEDEDEDYSETAQRRRG